MFILVEVGSDDLGGVHSKGRNIGVLVNVTVCDVPGRKYGVLYLQVVGRMSMVK